jgi:hypothetical protein
MAQKLLKTFSKLLACKLTDEELLRYGGELGSVIQDIAEEEDRQASLKQELKARLAGLEAKRTELATKLVRREELRDVEVQPERNYDANRYYEIRMDTGEIIKERPLSAEERQIGLKIEETDAVVREMNLKGK